MAGIYISGGTVTSSGDLTTDWMVEDPSAGGIFTAPEGTLTYVGRYTGAGAALNHCHYARGTFNHNNGLIVINPTKDGGTRSFSSTAGGVRDLYSLTVLSGSISASYATDVRYATACTLDGDLIVDGTSASAGNEPQFIPGSQNFDLVVAGDAIVTNAQLGGNFSYGTMTLASLRLNADALFDAPGDGPYGSGGTTTITGDDGNGYGIYGVTSDTFIHNSGTVILNPVVNRLQALYFNDNSSPAADAELYNLTVLSGTAAYVDADASWVRKVKVWNDLVVGAGRRFRPDEINDSNFFLDVVGLATVSGTLGHSSPWGGTAIPIILGALDIKSVGTYAATTGTTAINASSRFDGSASVLCWTLAAGGTFTPNGGTVNIHCAGGATPVDQSLFFSPNTGSFYDLEVQVPEGRYLYTQSGDDLLVDNDLTIQKPPSGGAIGTLGRWGTTTGVIVVSGTATIEEQGKIRWGADNPSNYGCTFGTLAIASGGTYEATPGTTLLKTDFSQVGTYTHNYGKIDFDNGTNFSIASANLLTGANALYDVDVSSGQVMVDNCDVDIEGDVAGGSSWVFYNGGTLTCGTASSSCTFNTPLGIYSIGWASPALKAKDSLYPVIMQSAGAISWRTQGGFPFYISDVDFSSIDITLPSGAKWVLSGACDFKGLTVDANAEFSASGQRASFADNFIGNGLSKFTDSLIYTTADWKPHYAAGADVYYGGSATVIHGGSDCNPFWGVTAGNEKYQSGSLTLVTTGSGKPTEIYSFPGYSGSQTDLRGNKYGIEKLIVIDDSFNPNGKTIGTTDDGASAPLGSLMISNGGTYLSTSGTSHTVDFSNRGGLFPSSSAFTFDSDGAAAYINCGQDSSIADIFDGGGTVEAWVNADSDGGTSTGMIASKIFWFVDVIGEDASKTKLSFKEHFTGDDSQWTTVSTELTNGKWHHVAVTYDSDLDTNNPTFYIDGKSVPISQDQPPTGDRKTDATSDLYLGDYSGGGTRMFDGRIAMVRLFDEVRTGAEIRTDMFNQKSDMDDIVGLVAMYQFDEGQGLSVTDVSTNSNTGTITLGGSEWATGGIWEAGGTLSSSAGTVTIGKRDADATLFASSYFPIGNRSLISGSKLASKAHDGTLNYYIDTSGAADYLTYTKLSTATIGVHNDAIILPDSYFSFDNDADNEQCNTLLNSAGSTVRILTNEDFYTQDFDNRGTWLRNGTYDGIIHDDGSTPHEYNPIDIMDDQDSGFDAEDLID